VFVKRPDNSVQRRKRSHLYTATLGGFPKGTPSTLTGDSQEGKIEKKVAILAGRNVEAGNPGRGDDPAFYSEGGRRERKKVIHTPRGDVSF